LFSSAASFFSLEDVRQDKGFAPPLCVRYRTDELDHTGYNESGKPMPEPIPLPICAVCNQLIHLEASKTDEHGQAVHEACYLLRVSLVAEPTCPICGKAMNLDARFSSIDENGRTVHTECYVGQIVKTTKSSRNDPRQPKA
jgi:hypothetical protein